MTQDVTLISTRLSPLSEAGKAVVSLETLVKDKSTPRRPMGETMKGLLRRNATGSTSTKGKEREVEEAAIEKVNLNADESEGDVEDEDGPGIIDNAEVKETEGENGHSEPPATPPSDHPLATSDKDPVLPPEVESQTLANDDPILPPKLPDKDDTPVLPLPIDKDEPPTLPDKPDLNEIPPPSHGDRAAEEELDIEETPSEAEKSAIPGIP
jgi:vacuolar protein sorting-associated protein 54